MQARKDMPQGDAKLTGLRLFLWDEDAAKDHVIPSDEGLFIFNVVSKQRNMDEEKATTAVHNFKLWSIVCGDFPDDVISKTNLFSPKAVAALSQQVSDHIQSCLRFWNCRNIMQFRPRLIFLADILIDDHQGLRTGISDKGLESHSQTDHGFDHGDDDDDDDDCNDHASNGQTGELGSNTITIEAVQDVGTIYLVNQLLGTVVPAANTLVVTTRTDVHDDTIKTTDLEGPEDGRNKEELNNVLGILRSATMKRQHDDPTEASPAKRIKLGYENNGLSKVKQTLKYLQGRERMVEKDHGQDDEVNEDLCSICLGKLKRDVEIVKLVRCKHTFHRQCLFKWLPKKQSCPCCRTSSLANVSFPS